MHTLQAGEKLKQAYEILELSKKFFTILSRYYEGMSMKQINTIVLNRYLKKVSPIPLFTFHSSTIKAMHEKILELYETRVGAEIARGTPWGAYNAVTEYVDHFRLESKSESTRLKSMWNGTDDMLKEKAFRCAVKILN